MKKLFGDKSNISDDDTEEKMRIKHRKQSQVPYKIGDIICGKVGKYPWWPCMVSEPPNDENENDEIRLSKVFVRYFGRPNEVSWLNLCNITMATSRQQLMDELNKGRHKQKNEGKYKDELSDAWDEVAEALTMTVEDRLHKFDIDYTVIEAHLKKKKKKIRPNVVVRKILVPVQNKTKMKEKQKEPIKYGFTELDMPLSTLGAYNKCCRYCLISNKLAIQCANNCGHNFHLICVNELKEKMSMEISDTDKCLECSLKSRVCEACSKELCQGDDETVNCSVNGCNKIYHSSCLNSGPLTEMTKKSVFDKVICPRHLCHRCELVEENPKFKCSKLIYCIMCPATYHTGDWCIPAGSVTLSKTEIICPRHLPNYGAVSNYIVPFVGRIESELRSEIYGDDIPSLNEIVPIVVKPPKDNKKSINLNWCFSCGKSGKLICCDTCPAAFHCECVNIDTMPEHYFCGNCTNGKYHTYGEIVWLKAGFFRWWPGQIMHIENVPDNILRKSHTCSQFAVQFFGTHEYLWMDRNRVFTFEEGDKHNLKAHNMSTIDKNFRLAIEEAEKGFHDRNYAWTTSSVGGVQKSRSYKHIKINRPVGNVQKSKKLEITTLPKCDCNYSCPGSSCSINSDCINIQLKYECHQSLCTMKERCQNQNFVKRNYPIQEVFCAPKCGWGLKTKEAIKKHQFVNEYVGEIIDNKEAERRSEWAKENNVTDFYFMELDSNRIIDARVYSNLSRFMNHSCNPNLFAEKWIVIDDQRIGLFALRDIEAGEELTFNYNLYSKSPSLLPCLCGSVNCSGFLGEQPKKIVQNKVETSKPAKKKLKPRPSKSKILMELDNAESISKESMTNSISTVSLNTIKSVDKQCFKCNESCHELIDKSCSLELCTKIYHSSCLDLPQDHDTQNWVCPWHFCDTCGLFATHTCELCTVSSCSKHFSPQLFQKMLSATEGICVNHQDNDEDTDEDC